MAGPSSCSDGRLFSLEGLESKQTKDNAQTVSAVQHKHGHQATPALACVQNRLTPTRDDTHLSSCQTPTIAPPPPRLPGDPAHPHRLPAACQCDVTQKERNKTNHESHGHRDESSGGRHGNPNRHGRSKVNICLESRRRGSLWTRGGVDVQSLAIKALFGNVSLLCCQEAQHGETKPAQRRGRYSSKGRDTLIAPCDPPLAFVYELIKHCSAAAGASSAPSPQRHLDSQWLLQSSFLQRPL